MADNALTGSVPYPTYQAPVNPLTQAAGALQVQQGYQGLQAQQLAMQNQQVTNASNLAGFMHSELSALATKPDLSFEDVTNLGTRLVGMGVPRASVANALSNLDPNNPKVLRGQLVNHIMALQSPDMKLAGATNGVPGTMSLGDIQQPVARNIYTNAVAPTGRGFTQGLTPGEKVSTQPQIGPGNIPINVPIGSKYDRTGNVLPTPVAPQSGAGAASNMAPRGMALPAGAVQAGQAPGTETAASTAAGGDASRAVAFEAAASKVPDMKAVLDRLDANAEAFTSGPASPLVKKFGGWANQIAGFGGMSPPVTSQAAREAFDKDAAILAGQQAEVLGGTDASKALAAVMTPGASNTNEGIKNIAAVLKGNQDAIAAKGQAWNAYKNSLPTGTARFSDFENQFNTHYSPRAFAMPYMSQQERQKMWGSMSQQEQDQVQRSYDEAKAKGYLKAHDSAAPTGATANAK